MLASDRADEIEGKNPFRRFLGAERGLLKVLACERPGGEGDINLGDGFGHLLVLTGAIFWLTAATASATLVRVTTWNLEWFPNGSPKDALPEEQTRRINGAAEILRKLNPDVLLLQEIRDYDTCSKLAEAIAPRTYQVAICSAFKEPFQPGFG